MSQLKDIRVLELASVLAGPGVGQFFAELGAEVIKVENFKAGGDVTRTWRSAGEETDDRSAYFCAVNWGKQSIGVDLTAPEGRAIVVQLARRADVVIASFKPGDAGRLGVDYEGLALDHPGLIYGQITGYGNDNQRVGYDAIIQAEAGFMSMNGEPGGPSLKMPVALMDLLAAHHLKEGILLAMLEKAKSGKGKLVTVSLLDAAVASLANQATNWLVANKLPQKQGSAHPNIAPYGDLFITADGVELILAVGTDKQFAQLIKILKINDNSKDYPLKTNALRVLHRRYLNGLLSAAIAGFPSTELIGLLAAHAIPAGIVKNVKEVTDDVSDRLRLDGGGLRGIRTFAANPGDDIPSHFSPPPHLGEHTRAILSDVLKFGPSAVQKLFQDGIVG